MPFPQIVVRLPILVFTVLVFLLSSLLTPRVASAWDGRLLVANPSSVSFGNIQVGGSRTQYETLTNSGNWTVTISKATLTGTGFSLSGLSLPLSLSRGQSVTFAAVYSPKSSGAASGAIAVVSTASNPNLNIGLSGSGVSGGQLTSSASVLTFGSVSLGSSKSLTATLAATGSSVTITSATSSSAEFLLSGLTLPKTIAAGQSTTVSVIFTPSSSGTASGSILLASNAANTPTLETLSGSGTATTAHSVSLQWNASASSVVGYNVYRSTISGSSYGKINSALDAGTNYVDGSVVAGKTYYYITKAVDAKGVESSASSQTQAAIPSP